MEGGREDDKDEGDVWTLPTFFNEYDALSRWLAQIYGAIYGNERKLAPESVRMMEAAALRKQSGRREKFLEQGNKLLTLHPNSFEEIQLRLDQLNAKWETFCQTLAIRRVRRKKQTRHTSEEKDIGCQVKGLREWLSDMETKLELIRTNKSGESRESLEDKLQQHGILQAEIQSHGSVVSSIVKFCEKGTRRREPNFINGGPSSSSPDFHGLEVEADDEAEDADEYSYSNSNSTSHHQNEDSHNKDIACFRLAATSLERRWHRLWLRSLELQCVLEERLQKLYKGGPPSERWSESDRDEEPLSKYPRLAPSFRPSDDSNCEEVFDDVIDGPVHHRHDGNADEPELQDDRDVLANSDDDPDQINGHDLNFSEQTLNGFSHEDEEHDAELGRMPQQTEVDVMTTDCEPALERGKEPVLQVISAPAQMKAHDGEPKADASSAAPRPSIAGMRLPNGEGGSKLVMERDKCSPGKLCGSHWTGPNCASFHFKDVEADSETEHGTRVGIVGRTSNLIQPQITTPVKMMTIGQPQAQQAENRPKLVARVSPRRRLELGIDDDSKILKITTNKDWWAVTSSESDWLNTEGLSDSDGSGWGCEEPPVADENVTPPRLHSVSISISEGGNRPQDLCLRRSCSKHSIHRLVNAADEMVRRNGDGNVGVGNGNWHKRPSSLRTGPGSEQLPAGAKIDRITAWLSSQPAEPGHAQLLDSLPPAILSDAQMGDSCDASGEYTTEDSDASASPSPSDSEEHNSSIVTCHLQQSVSGGSKGLPGADTDLDTPIQERMPTFAFCGASNSGHHSVLHTPEGGEGKRWGGAHGVSSWKKWSAGDLLRTPVPGGRFGLREHNTQSLWSLSKSDTALNCTVPGPSLKAASLHNCNVGKKRCGGYGSFSTLHGSGGITNTRKSSFSDTRPSRDMRGRHRRDMEKDRLTPRSSRKPLNFGSASHIKVYRRPSSLKKSKSFSGRCNRLALGSRELSFSDPQASAVGSSPSKVTSTEDLVAECQPATVPAMAAVLAQVINVSPDVGVVAAPIPSPSAVNEDVCLSQMEETSSVSEQAWDPYQAPVLFVDENYSESGMDSEAVKKLLDWDDDYRNVLDSLSDATSSVPPAAGVKRRGYSGQYQRPMRRRKALRQPYGCKASGDSDSDADPAKMLGMVVSANRKSWPTGRPFLPQGDFGERSWHVGGLTGDVQLVAASPYPKVAGRPSRASPVPGSPEALLRSSSVRGRSLLESSPSKARVERAKEDLERLKAEMQDVEARMQEALSCGSVKSRGDVADVVGKLKACIEELCAQKRVLFNLNLEVHFLTSTGTSPGYEKQSAGILVHLKDLVDQLYRRWEDIGHTAGGSVSKMERVLCDWEDWENAYGSFMASLSDEKEAVSRAFIAESASPTAEDVNATASIVQLELRKSQVESVMAGFDAKMEELPTTLEARMNECEARLKVMEERRQKIVDMMPARSSASHFFHQAMERAVDELNSLRTQCKQTLKVAPRPYAGLVPKHTFAARERSPSRTQVQPVAERISWSSRLMRSALPIQVALLAAICIAFLIEPKCCDPSNNFGSWFSFHPLVKYTHGPPPS